MEEHKDKVLASRIESITLHNGKWTSARRVPAIPQLKCIGGNGQGLFEVENMRCRAQGRSYDEIDIQWTCTAEIDPSFKLGSTQVLCEGYDHPDDPYILKGSCGVEYRLILTEEGEAKYSRHIRHIRHQQKGKGASVAAVAFASLFIVFAVIIFTGIYRRWRENRERNGRMLLSDNIDNDDNDSDQPPPRFLKDEDDDMKDPPPPYTEAPDTTVVLRSEETTSSFPRGLGYTPAAQDVGIAANRLTRRTQTQEAYENDGQGSSSSPAIQLEANNDGGEDRVVFPGRTRLREGYVDQAEDRYASTRRSRLEEYDTFGEGSSSYRTTQRTEYGTTDNGRSWTHQHVWTSATRTRGNNTSNNGNSSQWSESTGFGGTTRR